MTGPQLGTAMAPADTPIAARFQWRHQYDSARDAIEQELSNSVNNEPSMTMQKFTDDADINIVLARFGVGDGSILPALDKMLAEQMKNIDPSYYGDFTEATDLKTALDRFQEAERRFMELPAKIRSRFNNRWEQLFEWVSDPANGEEAVAMGLLTHAPAPVPPATPPTTTPAPATQTP